MHRFQPLQTYAEEYATRCKNIIGVSKNCGDFYTPYIQLIINQYTYILGCLYYNNFLFFYLKQFKILLTFVFSNFMRKNIMIKFSNDLHLRFVWIGKLKLDKLSRYFVSLVGGRAKLSLSVVLRVLMVTTIAETIL